MGRSDLRPRDTGRRALRVLLDAPIVVVLGYFALTGAVSTLRFTRWLVFDPSDGWGVTLEHWASQVMLGAALFGMVRARRWSRWPAAGIVLWLVAATFVDPLIVDDVGLSIGRGIYAAILILLAGSLIARAALDSGSAPWRDALIGALGFSVLPHLVHFAFAIELANGPGLVIVMALIELAVMSAAVTLHFRQHPSADRAQRVAALSLGMLSVLGVLTARSMSLENAIHPAVRWEEIDAHRGLTVWATSIAYVATVLVRWVASDRGVSRSLGAPGDGA